MSLAIAKFFICNFTCTVKLGFKDNGYNELMVMTNKHSRLFCFDFGPEWLIYYINLHCYNDFKVIINKCGWSLRSRINRV